MNKDELEKHEKKCNFRPLPTPPYFSLNINCTLPFPESEERVTLSDLSKETLNRLINNVNQWFQQLVPNIKTEVLDHMVLKEKKYASFELEFFFSLQFYDFALNI